MSSFSGPEKLSKELVFAFDMGNIQKSWLGAPATNLITEHNYANWSKSASLKIELSPYTTPFNTASYTMSDGTNTNYLLMSRNITVPNDSSTYMISVFVRKTFGGTSARLGFNVGFSGGTTVSSNPRFNSDTGVGNTGSVINFGEWWYWYFSITNNSSGNTNLYCEFYPATGVYNGNDSVTGIGTVTIGALMINSGSVASRFTTGTRSTTQAILDLTGLNTITSSDLTYSSGNEFSFNGSTNFLRPSITHSYLNSSCLEVWFRSSSHGSGNKTIFGYRHNEGYSLPTIGSMYLNGNNLYGSLITTSQVYRTVLAASTISTNTWYHAALNKNTQTGNFDLYLNGQLSGTQTFDVSTYGQWPNAGNFIGDNILDIAKSTNTNAGQGWSSDYFTGSIPIAKVYNRTLTTSEIRQNFNALRGRFGL